MPGNLVGHAIYALAAAPALLAVVEFSLRRLAKVSSGLAVHGSLPTLRRGFYAMLAAIMITAFALPLRYEVTWLVAFLLLMPILLGSLIGFALTQKARGLE
ncbi:MAG TPA: hypothetical protein VIN40_03790 [Candidatus Tyrphobacter sp.]